MANYKSATGYEIEIENHFEGVAARLVAPLEPHVTCYEYKDGTLVACEEKQASQVIPGFDRRSMPVALISAAKDDKSGFWCDLDAGFQRWIGWKTTREVGAALKRAGFTPKEAAAVRKELRAAPAGRVRACR